MTCHSCRIDAKRHGKDRKGNQRFKCSQCSKTFLAPQQKPLEGMYLPLDKAEMILKLMVEGSSVSTIERLTGVHHGTILKLLVLVGEKCDRIMADKVRNIEVRDVEIDEVWSYIGKKEKRVRAGDDPNFGDAYTFVAIERHSKLVLNIALSKRNETTTNIFIEGLRHATAPKPFQLSADGFRAYPFAVESTLADRVDFAQLIKVYRATVEGERRYSPAEVVTTEKIPVIGNPDPKRICTSIVERSNLSLRMGMRRFTRLTNAFSKKWENHWAAITLWFTFYNFCSIHKSLRVTPAMAAGITDRVWDIGDLLA